MPDKNPPPYTLEAPGERHLSGRTMDIRSFQIRIHQLGNNTLGYHRIR